MAKEQPLTDYVRGRITELLRSGNGPNQQEVADRLGAWQQRISDLASGQWRNPSLDVLDGVLRAYDQTLAGVILDYYALTRPPGTKKVVAELRQMLPMLSRTALDALLVQAQAHQRGRWTRAHDNSE